MRKIFGIIAGLGLGAGCMLAPSAANATCGTPINFNQGTSGSCTAGYCYVTSPGVGTSASIAGTFWGLTGGDPAIGAGDDNGSSPVANWTLTYPGGLFIYGNWAGDAAFDGCIGNEGSSAKMPVQFSDTDATGSTAYFAAACVTRNVTVSFQFDYGTIGQNIALKALPQPTISGSVRVGNEAQVTVASPDFSSFYYTDGSAGCAIGSVIPSYDVWLNTVARNAAAPTSRLSTDGWSLGGTCTVGQPCTVTTACGTTNCDVYLAVSPHFDSGFQAGNAGGPVHVGANSLRIMAGPTLANPPNFKIIHKSPKEKISQ